MKKIAPYKPTKEQIEKEWTGKMPTVPVTIGIDYASGPSRTAIKVQPIKPFGKRGVAK